MKPTTKFISDILLEAACDSRVENGTPDLSNPLHIEVLAECMFDRGLSPQVVAEVVNALQIREAGKHPERQAYNKEGWLVTFPSPEYKQAAIKRGTHYGSDPTHGKGGMNVYYKKKGKQARKDTQQLSTTEPTEPTKSVEPVKSVAPQSAANVSKSSSTELPSSDTSTDKGDVNSNLPVSGNDQQGEEPEEEPLTNAQISAMGGNKSSSDTSTKEPSAPAAPAAPVAPPTPDFVNISVEFAKSKSWSPTPYGEWRNPAGEQTAVVALSGEVVPVKSTDREELKLLSTKSIN